MIQLQLNVNADRYSASNWNIPQIAKLRDIDTLIKCVFSTGVNIALITKR